MVAARDLGGIVVGVVTAGLASDDDAAAVLLADLTDLELCAVAGGLSAAAAHFLRLAAEGMDCTPEEYLQAWAIYRETTR